MNQLSAMQHQPPVDLKPFFLTLEDLEGPLDWRAFFGNDHPVEIDVGSGRGLFLVNAAQENPGINYLGIEIDYREGRRGARRLQKRALRNARVLGGDARITLRKFLPPASVQAVHVYFPDPWWKRRHRRRRLFTDEFVSQMADVLQPGGQVHLWTDVADYFHVMQALMNHDGRFTQLPPPPEHAPAFDMDYHTSYERKRRQAGCTIHRGHWQRRAGR